MKKALSVLLSLAMIITVLAVLPLSAQALSYEQDSLLGGHTFEYILSGGQAKITGFTPKGGVESTAKNITIPSIIYGNTVIEIGEAAFQEIDYIESVTIPASVTTINNSAFNLCSGLSSVTFGGSGLITIGNYAFAGTAISGISLPNTVQYITDHAFEYCENLTSITIPNSVKKIFTGAFYNCTALTNVTIGSKVENIANDAFGSCSALTSISVNSSNEYYSSQNGVLYNKDKTTLMLYPQGKTNTGFELPNTVVTINPYAFRGNTSLTQLIISPTSSSLTTIGDYAFADCSNLKSIMDIPATLTSVGTGAFSGVANDLYVKSKCTVSLVGSDIIQGYSTRTWDKDHGKTDSGTITTQPTCTAKGVKSYKCVDCGEVLSTEPVQEKEHFPLAAVVENEVLATCTEDGTYDEVVYCGICEAELSRTPKIEIAKGHAPGKPIKIIGAPATYDKVGYYDLIVYCSVCDAELSREEDIEIPKLKKTSLAKATVSGIVNKTYTGKNTSQKITVKLGGKTLVEGKDYKVSLKNCANVGTATLTVSGIKAYSGTIKKTYKINPKNTTLSKVTAGKKAFTAKWKKQTQQTTGYELQYSTNKSFKKGNKTVKITKNKTISKTVKKLNAKKKYYVRIRTYKTVKGTKYCSSWSKAKTVTTKK